MGVTHRDSEEVIQELADTLAVKLFAREFDGLTDEQKYKCWEQAGEDFHSRRIDAVMDRVELRPCPDSLPCPDCGGELQSFSGLESIPAFLFCGKCNNKAVDGSGQVIARLE